MCALHMQMVAPESPRKGGTAGAAGTRSAEEGWEESSAAAPAEERRSKNAGRQEGHSRMTGARQIPA